VAAGCWHRGRIPTAWFYGPAGAHFCAGAPKRGAANWVYVLRLRGGPRIGVGEHDAFVLRAQYDAF
jgi:hypothetical protein